MGLEPILHTNHKSFGFETIRFPLCLFLGRCCIYITIFVEAVFSILLRVVVTVIFVSSIAFGMMMAVMF